MLPHAVRLAISLTLVGVAQAGPASAPAAFQSSPDRTALIAPPAVVASTRDVDKLRKRLRKDILALTGALLDDKVVRPTMQMLSTSQRQGYELTGFMMPVENGTLRGVLAVPKRSSKMRATLLMDTRPLDALTATDGDVDLLARDGTIVMALEPRPATAVPSTAQLTSDSLLAAAPSPLRTLVGVRIDDTRLALSWLARHPAASSNLGVHGVGPHAIVALHAAVLEERIRTVVVEDMVASYRLLLDGKPTADVQQTIVPGLLRRYDVGDLVLATFPAEVAIVTPIDGSGKRLSGQAFSSLFAETAKSDEKLKAAPVRVPRITAALAP